MALKELRETLRDRRTVITLVLMPVLVYPLLSIVFQRFLVTSLRPSSQIVYRIGVEAGLSERDVLDLLSFGSQVLERAERGRIPGQPADRRRPVTSAANAPAALEDVEVVAVPDIEKAASEMEIDVGIRVTDRGPLDPNHGVPRWLACESVVVGSSPRSRAAFSYLDRRLRAVNVEVLRRRLSRVQPDVILPVNASRRIIQAAPGAASFSLAALIPLILILMTITGAVYPAIDLTAGERERGTLEALIAAPIPRLGVLLAKYVTVVFVALLTAGVNLVAMSLTIASAGLGSLLFGDSPIAMTLLKIFGLLVLFAAFFSAALLAITSFARSFKEAQAYLIPVMLIALAPGLLSLVPGIELNGLLAVTPLANIVLLARDVLEGQASAVLAAVVVMSTAVYALAAIAAAARIFGTDAILYGSHGSWSDVFRRPAVPAPAAQPSAALFCLAVTFALAVLTAGALARLSDLPVAQRLILSSVATAMLFFGLPLAAALLGGVRLGSGFRLHAARPAAFAGAALLGLSLWPFAYELVLAAGALADMLGAKLLDRRLVDLASRATNELRTVFPLWLLWTLSVVPAVAEELFFRGYLFAALRRKMSGWRTVIVTALLFGLFHVVVRDKLAFERFLPSTLLGLVLGGLALRSGSVVPGMLLHASHNGILLAIAVWHEELRQVRWLNFGNWMSAPAGHGHLPAQLLAVAALGVLGGGALALLAKRRRNHPVQENSQDGAPTPAGYDAATPVEVHQV
ncbi:MAG: ABC transporter permease subunit [Planctomycetes bacterium]|nr:ABC transporter permease subunit [Planctomycetota bacterium]